MRGPLRAGVVAAFCLQVVLTQVLWLSFAPIAERSGRALGVGAGAVGDLAAVNPLLFVLLALPAGRWLDRAPVPPLLLGAGLTAAGAVVRALGAGSYPVVLTGQVVLSLGQPLLLGASTVVAVRYAAVAARSATIAATGASQFVGILVAALGAGPLLSAVGFAGSLRIEAVAAVAVGVVLAALLLLVPPAEAALASTAPSRPLWRDPFLVALGVVLFVGVGVFNAVATWLDAILVGLDRPGRAGALIAATTVAGIAGTAVLPVLAARTGRRRGVLVTAGLLTAAAFVVLALDPAPLLLATLLPVVGLVLLPGLPICLEWAEEHAGPDAAARTTTLLLTAGNLGGVVVVLLVQPVVDRPAAALLTVAALALPAVAAALLLPRSSGRRAPAEDALVTPGGGWPR